MRSRHTLVFVPYTLIVLTLCYASQVNESSALSPSFARQEITDELLDMEPINANGTNLPISLSKLVKTGTNCSRLDLPEIESVSYLSDGKVLNATIWLSDLIEKDPPIYRMPVYRMGIGNIPTHGTTLEIDYFVTVYWDISNQTWVKAIEEYSSSGDKKILDRRYNYTNFSDDEQKESLITSNQSKSRIALSLDLETVGSPNEYFLIFGLYDSNIKRGTGLCVVADFADTLAYVPPAEFDISISENPLTLRAGEDKTTQLKVLISTIARPNISIASNQDENIEINFVPNRTYVPAGGMVTSLITIKALDKAADCLINTGASERAADCPYTLPIYANITFPKIDFVNVGLEDAATVTNKITTSVIPRPSYFTVIVQPSLSLQEQFKEIWSTYGGAINLVGGGFAAGFAALIFDKLRKKHEIEKEKQKE